MTATNGKWRYKELTASQADEALSSANEFINKEHPVGVKVCASDMKEKSARAVVFYCKDMPIQTIQPFSDTEWKMITKSVGSDYEEMYDYILNELNSLRPIEQFYASIAFTNMRQKKAHMSIYYPVIE